LRWILFFFLTTGCLACSEIFSPNDGGTLPKPGHELVDIRFPSALKLDTIDGRYVVSIDTLQDRIATYHVPADLYRGWQVFVYRIVPPERTLISSRLQSHPRIWGNYYRSADSVPAVPTDDRYWIELEIGFFETNQVPGHLWSPQSGSEYRVLFRRTLTSPVLYRP